MMGVPGAAAGVYLPETEWTLRSNSTCRQCRRYAVPARRQSVGSRGADDDEPLRVTGCVNVVVQRSPVLHSSAPSPESPRPLRGSPRNAGGRGCEQRCQQPPVRRDMIAPAEDFCEKLCLCAALIQRRVEISPTPLVMCRKPSAHIAHAPEVRQATVHGAAVKITGVGRQKNDFFLDSSARRCKTPPPRDLLWQATPLLELQWRDVERDRTGHSPLRQVRGARVAGRAASARSSRATSNERRATRPRRRGRLELLGIPAADLRSCRGTQGIMARSARAQSRLRAHAEQGCLRRSRAECLDI